MSENLLPPSSTALERNLTKALAKAEDLPVPVRDIHDPDACPLALLPYLAWAYSVDEWDDSWPEHLKRQAVKDALLLHRRKGTVWAVKRIIGNQGFVLRRLIEHSGRFALNGTTPLRGWFALGWPLGAFCYRIVVQNRNLTAAQLDSLRRALHEVAPAREKLMGIHFENLPIPLNGKARLDGTYRLGGGYA